jgi:PAS domain S-box-containing protein
MENVQFIWSLIEGTTDLVQTIRPDGGLEFVNKTWLNVMKYSIEETENLTIENIIFPGSIRDFKAHLSRVLQGEKFSGLEVTLITKDNELVPVEANLFPRYDQDEIIAIEGFYRDVRDKKKAEDELREQQSRTEFFIDLMTHDLTNIHQEILSTLEILLLDLTHTPQSIEIIKECLVEIERGANLISNVKKLSELYARTPEIKKIDPADSVKTAINSTRSANPDKELRVNTNLESGKYYVIADSYLKDIFQSLLFNSIKFDDKKIVEIDIHVEPLIHTPFLRFEISDRGCGIPDDEKEEIFARIAHRREGILGLGLGLTLVKQILGNYGGQIMVQDRVEGDHTKGTKMVVLLRYEQITPNKMEVD